jgi:predicted transposase YdaD
MSTLEEWYTKGKLEGELKGRLEGELKGRLESKLEGKIERMIRDILRLLNNRFHEVPESISHTVNSYTDLIALDSLFDRACECKTLTEFEEYLAHP